jgi:Flp pilus assembly protein TadG
MSSLNPSTRKHRGLATLEMALILPLLLVLVFGLLEYGWLFFKNQQIAAASRTACRYGITAPATTAETVARIDTLMAQASLAGSGYSATCTPCEVGSGTFVTVRISVPYSNLQLTGFPLPLPTSLVGETTMAKEGPP